MRNIFIIGPGGTGKTTCGALLAKELAYLLIDLDQHFMKEIGDINRHIDTYGKDAYRYANSALFYTLLAENPKNTVFALSSGFLVYDGTGNLNEKHSKTIHEDGVSILLLPSREREEATDIIVQRQLSKGISGMTEKGERKKITDRFHRYEQYGHIKIYSKDTPENIVKIMKEELVKLA